MTTVTFIQIVAPAQLGGSDASVYTGDALTMTQIGRAVFTNTTASVVAITAGITTGGALGALAMISARPLAPGEAYVSPELAGAAIPAGSALRAFAGSAAAVTIEVSGYIFQ